MFVKIHKKVLLEEWVVSIGSQVAKRRRELRLTQQNLAVYGIIYLSSLLHISNEP